jgi:hypothetical protein
VADTLINTHQLRQNIINELVRIAKKSVFLLDNYRIDLAHHTQLLTFEQKNRFIFDENINNYFASHKSRGILTMLFGKTDAGMLFKMRQ